MKKPSVVLEVSNEEYEMLRGVRAMQERIELDGGVPRLVWFVLAETSDPEMLDAQKKLIADLLDP